MFLNSRTRWMLKESQAFFEELRESPRFDALICIRCDDGVLDKRYGTLSLGGCDFETLLDLRVGQTVELELCLLGMKRQLTVCGTVIRTQPNPSPDRGTKVAVRFQDVCFETERLIARWLDWLSHGYRFTIV